MSRLLGRRKIAVVEDDEESTFANPNDLGRASGLSDDFSVLDDDPNDLARMSGMSELARASGSLGLTRSSVGERGPRGVDEMELLLGDIKKMAAKMRSKNQRRKDERRKTPRRWFEANWRSSTTFATRCSIAMIQMRESHQIRRHRTS